MARYCSKIYIWDPGDIYLNQKAKVSTCTFWARIHVIILKIYIFLCLNILCILLFTKLYSILISEWIFWSKILKRNKFEIQCIIYVSIYDFYQARHRLCLNSFRSKNLVYYIKNLNIAATIWIGHNFQIQKRIVSAEKLYEEIREQINPC